MSDTPETQVVKSTTTETVTATTDTQVASEGTEAVEPAKQVDDAGQAEVQARMDVATAQGYVGQKVDPLPNEAHSLESGPDSPTIDPDTRA